MNAATIQMEPEVARAKLAAYREALAGRHSKAVEEEYEAAMRGFAELAKGTVLVDAFSAIREAGWRADGRPALAMARADQRQVEWTCGHSRIWNWNNETKIGEYSGRYAPMIWRYLARKARSSTQRRGQNLVRVDNISVEPPAVPKTGIAMIPLVPPDVLPSRGCDLSKHYIPWEVESWDYVPPVDPMLLRPIGGDLYAVVAQWDLTELERAIIAGTRR